MKRLGVLASGRGSNLRALYAATQGGPLAGVAEIVLVAGDKPEAAALSFARERGIATVAQPKGGLTREAWDAALVEALAPHRLDVIVLAGFMRILSKVFVSAYEGRILNVHPADTREHQGLDGYGFAFRAKLPATKVTVHVVDHGLDTGPIVAQREVDLRGAETLEEVELRGLAVEHALYPEALREFLEHAALGPKN